MKVNVSENQKALCLFIAFFVVMGCAGQGDYEEKKRHEVVEFKQCK
jgi:hypothetical protein